MTSPKAAAADTAPCASSVNLRWHRRHKLWNGLVMRCHAACMQANIKEERDAIAELDDLVMHRALTPVQAAIFIIESFPGRPDGFALVDALAQMPGALPGLLPAAYLQPLTDLKQHILHLSTCA